MHYFTRPSVFLILILLSFFSTTLSATDREKEQRWAEQVTDSLLDGEAIYLHDGVSEFLAIDTRADKPNDIGIIVIHGIGIHPDWPAIVQPLRVQLAEEGWNTLALQMPVLSNEATGKDYEPLMKEVPARIDAGIRYMFKNGAKKVILVAHSMGARMANYYLAHKKIYHEAQTETPIIAYVGIGMNKGNESYLKQINLPMLDLYGEKDLTGVLASAITRAEAGASNKQYQQRKIASANHFFEDQDNDLINAVINFLKRF